MKCDINCAVIDLFILLGHIGVTGIRKEEDSYHSSTSENVRKRGTASSFLDSKGFGWLLEIEDDDERKQKPLL